MNLGVLLPLGDSLKSYRDHGQDVRFVKYYLGHYCRKFDKVFLFTYQRESYSGLPKNCFLVTPPLNIHRYLYGLIMPFLKTKEFRLCDIYRCFHPSATLPAIVGKLFFGKKFIFNFNYDYVLWAKVESKDYLIPWLRINHWLAFKLCEKVFVADENMEKYAQQFVNPAKIVVVRNAVDTTLFRPTKRVPKERIILSVGRLETQKNYIQLIKGISLLKEKVKVVIVGRGQLHTELTNMAGQKNVDLEITEMIPHDKLPKIYQSADVYVQPSLMEAPVKTLLEAMSCALPCVASDVPGIRDVITDGKNGLLTKLNPKDIALKISIILQNKTLSTKLGQSARKLIVEKYNLFKILDIETDKLLHV